MAFVENKFFQKSKSCSSLDQSNCVVATTCQNSTRSLLTSAKLSVGYLVVGITRELDKKPLLYWSSIYYRLLVCTTTIITCPYVYALSSCPITHPHVFSLRPPCFLHVPWHHTLNLCYTYAHYVYIIRNHCPLTSLLTLTPSLDSSQSF